MIAAYREPDKKHGKAMMQAVIDSVASGVPATLAEIRKLGRTLKQRATDILAFFDRPARRTAPSRPSTAGSNTSAAAPSDSGT
jgi:transposase